MKMETLVHTQAMLQVLYVYIENSVRRHEPIYSCEKIRKDESSCLETLDGLSQTPFQ